ncbi:hypothetical protein QKW52_22085 [Bacillus sonorensis]|nr:hypothetical protein [Bacillus sonorensis]
MDYKELADEYGKVIRRKAKRIRMAKERLSILAMEILPEIESEEKENGLKAILNTYLITWKKVMTRKTIHIIPERDFDAF